MPDLQIRFRGADRIPAPDLWDDIERREREPLHPEPSPSRRLAVILLALGVAAGGLTVAVRAIDRPGGRRATSTTPNGRIAFSAMAEGTWQIFSVEPEGSGLRQLTHVSGAVAESPVWSPDGTRLAYQVVENGGGGPTQIWIMNADGSDQRQLIQGAGSYWSPAWSPDGTRIAVSHPGGLFTVNPDGTDLTQVTHGIDGAYPSWSPDGSRIAFGEGGEVQHLYVVNADGTDQTTLIDRPGTWQNFPAWSPDGSTIAFAASNTQGSGFGIYAVNPDGTDLRKLTDQPAAQSPAWAPDGSRIVFMAPRPGTTENTTLYVMNADGTDVRELPGLPEGASSPSWQAVQLSTAPSTSSPPPVPSVGVTEGTRLHLAQVGGLFSVQEAFGSIWAAVMVGGDERLLRADPATGRIQHTFPLAEFPAHEWGGGGLVAGHGAIWVADADAGLNKGIIERIDPATDAVKRITLDGRGVEDLAFDSGILWALLPQNAHGDAEVDAIDPATDVVVSSTPFHADWYGGVFPVAGAVWTVERDVSGSNVQGGRLVQIVPGDARRIILGGSFALPASDATSIWTPYFGDSKAMNLATGIARINPATGEMLSAWKTDAVGDDLAVGLDGGIWFLSGDHLERLNPSTGETDVDVAVAGGPIFIVPTHGGGIWVGTYKGELIRFDAMTRTATP